MKQEKKQWCIFRLNRYAIAELANVMSQNFGAYVQHRLKKRLYRCGFSKEGLGNFVHDYLSRLGGHNILKVFPSGMFLAQD